jgi:hypothetical protein
MNASATLQRLERFLYWLAVILFVGTIAELLAAKHWKDPIQFLPFALCLLGLALLWRTRAETTPARVKQARIGMTGIALASLIGVYEHLQGNLGFIHETRPHADMKTVILGMLTGHAPLLASGVLAVAAVVSIAATEAAVALAAPAQATGGEDAWRRGALGWSRQARS